MLTELVSKMRDMQMDKSELGCLRAIVLFNPGTETHTHTCTYTKPLANTYLKGKKRKKKNSELPIVKVLLNLPRCVHEDICGLHFTILNAIFCIRAILSAE